MEKLILSTAHYLFTKDGIVHYKMSDLASKLGISKKTLYKFYPTKEFLVSRVLDRMLEEHQNRISSNVDIYTGNTLREIIGIAQSIFLLGKDVDTRFFNDLQSQFPNQWKIFNDSLEQTCFLRMRVLLEKGISESIIRGNLHPAMWIDLWKKHLVNDFEYAAELINQYSKDEVYWQCLSFFVQGIINKSMMDESEEILHEIFESSHLIHA